MARSVPDNVRSDRGQKSSRGETLVRGEQASKPVAQPDPHEAAAIDYLSTWWRADASVDQAPVQALARRFREREAAAERRGAEAMREKLAEDMPNIAKLIRALPLPGDK
jgi:hypothetical protein